LGPLANVWGALVGRSFLPPTTTTTAHADWLRVGPGAPAPLEPSKGFLAPVLIQDQEVGGKQTPVPPPDPAVCPIEIVRGQTVAESLQGIDKTVSGGWISSAASSCGVAAGRCSGGLGRKHGERRHGGERGHQVGLVGVVPPHDGSEGLEDVNANLG
jgi:hypothetical protein